LGEECNLLSRSPSFSDKEDRKMNYRTAMIGLAALATTAFAAPASAAMPNGLPPGARPQNAEQVRYVCNFRGRCWWQPGPRFYGGPYAYGPRWHRGWGYGPRRHWRRW
jgi:hypothetical protein